VSWRTALLCVVMAVPAAATTQVHYVMGTYLRVVTDDDVPAAALAGCFTDARTLDRTFSRFDAASELTRLNASGGGPGSPRFRDALAQALALARATDGAFDVSVGALTALWRAPERPAPAAVRAARRSIGGATVAGDRVVLARGTRLDFDGFAKGVAVDACVVALRAAGVTRALVSFGESSLYGLGAPRGETAWRLDVRGSDPTRAVARLELRDAAAAISAVYGEHRIAGRRGHIVDPRSGTPLVDDAVSVVVMPRASDAEAWAKAVLVDGSRGVAHAEARGGVAAARITPRGVEVGPALRASAAFHLYAHARAISPAAELR
jgi:FAD:protein FMN transferase